MDRRPSPPKSPPEVAPTLEAEQIKDRKLLGKIFTTIQKMRFVNFVGTFDEANHALRLQITYASVPNARKILAALEKQKLLITETLIQTTVSITTTIQLTRTEIKHCLPGLQLISL